MCSCLSPAARWTGPLPLLACGVGEVGERVAPLVRRPRWLQLPPQLHRWGLQALADPEPGREFEAGCRAPGGHDGANGLVATAAAAQILRRHRSAPRAGNRAIRVGLSVPLPGPPSLAGSGIRRLKNQETSAAKAQGCPALAFPIAVCAACRGRASICACCTCNTPG